MRGRGGRIHVLMQRRPIQSLIIAQHRESRILKLEISTWFKVVEDLLYHSTIIFETCDDSTSVDVIKRFGEVPVVLCIVDLELAIWWDTVIIRKGVWKGAIWETYKRGWIGLRSVPITVDSVFS